MSIIEPPTKKAKVLRTPGFVVPSKPAFKLPSTTAIRSPSTFNTRNDFKSTFGKENLNRSHASNVLSPLKTPSLPFAIASTPCRKRSREPLSQSYDTNTNTYTSPSSKKGGAFSVADALANPFVQPSPSPKSFARRVLEIPSFDRPQSPNTIKCIGPPESPSSARKNALRELSQPPAYAYTPSTTHLSAPLNDSLANVGNTDHYHQEISKGLHLSPKKRDPAYGWGGRARKFVRHVFSLTFICEYIFTRIQERPRGTFFGSSQ